MFFFSSRRRHTRYWRYWSSDVCSSDLCKQEGINTAIETCGYTKLETILKVAEFTDLFLFDVKHIDSQTHFELTGVRNEQILENLQELLRRKYNVKRSEEHTSELPVTPISRMPSSA